MPPVTNPQQVIVPNRTYVYLAPVGTVAPVDATSDPGAGWRFVGLTTPDSLTFSTEPTFEEVAAAQSDHPVRRFMTGETATLEVDLIQWNVDNMKSLYGGGNVVQVSAGLYRYTPPTFGDRMELACLIDVVDGLKNYRYIIPRTLQVEGVSAELQKGQEARLPLRLAVLGGDSVAPWSMLTNDASYFPTPTLSAVAPSTGGTAGGTAIVITGNNLTGATGGTLGGVALTSFVVVNDNRITAVTPATTAGAKTLLVTTAAAVASLASAFTYV